MHQVTSNYYSCSRRCHANWIAVIAALLCTLCVCAGAQAESDRELRRFNSLFDVPLASLLNLQVTADGSRLDQQGEIFNISGRALKAAARKGRRTLGKRSKRPAETKNPIEQLINVDSSKSTVLLAIDGYSIEKINHYSTLIDYVKYFGRSLNRVELYYGESAAWWSNNRAQVVVNLITNTQPELSSLAQESRQEALIQ